MVADAVRPVWILVGGHHPVALATLGKKRFPRGATHWCHEGDPCWSHLTDDDRARLGRQARSRRRFCTATMILED
jgi:hypothetical protein